MLEEDLGWGTRAQPRVRTGHRGAGAGGGEVEACHLFVAVVLDTDELPLIYHTWRQAFDGVRIQVAGNGGLPPMAWRIFLKISKKRNHVSIHKGGHSEMILSQRTRDLGSSLVEKNHGKLESEQGLAAEFNINNNYYYR